MDNNHVRPVQPRLDHCRAEMAASFLGPGFKIRQSVGRYRLRGTAIPVEAWMLGPRKPKGIKPNRTAIMPNEPHQLPANRTFRVDGLLDGLVIKAPSATIT